MTISNYSVTRLEQCPPQPDGTEIVVADILGLPLTWWERARFRSKLRADIRDRSDFLRDVGIDVLEAHAEACRFFWQPITLKRP